MPRIKLTEVLSFSSEDPNHPADNLLSSQTFRKWKIAASEVGHQASITMRLEKLTTVRSLDIGNDGCAFAEVLVARDDDKFEVLLPASSFMSPLESRNGTDQSRVRMFGSDKLNKLVMEQKWSRVKVVCTQPFNKQLQFGLSFITLNAPDPPQSALTLGGLALMDEEDCAITVGSLFARRRETAAASDVSLAGAATRNSPTPPAAGQDLATKRKSEEDVGGHYQLKKKHNNKTGTDSSDAATSLASKARADKTSNQSHHKTQKDQTDNGRTKNTNHNIAKAVPNKNRKNDKSSDVTNTSRVTTHPLQTAAATTTTTATATTNGGGGGGGGGINNRRTLDITVPTQSRNKGATSTAPVRQYEAFSSLLSSVVYGISGYQNPSRSQLRDKMTEMGARYRADWDGSCTHLLCAFSNTPKFQQVKGKGKIVGHRWVEDCHAFKKRMPWKRYRLDKDVSSDESEDEVWAEELRPVVPSVVAAPAAKGGSSAASTSDTPTTSKMSELSSSEDEPDYGGDTDGEEDTDEELQRVLHKNRGPNARDTTAAVAADSDTVYDEDTDVEDGQLSPRKQRGCGTAQGDKAATTGSLPPLLDCFTGKVFFLYQSPQYSDCLRRYIVAFDGIVSEYMDDTVQYVVTDQDWDTAFDEAAQDHPSLQFVRPAWVWQCSDQQRLLPPQQFLVMPPRS